jgi:glutaredoxin
MSKNVIFYSTSATGMLQTKKNITSIKNLLDAHSIKYTEIDCAVDANAPHKEHMFKISGKKQLPQVHVDDQYVGGWDELEIINEEGRVDAVFK